MEYKWLHFSDSHLGFAQFGLHERVEDFGRRFSEVVNAALRERVDFVLHSGNLFHEHAPRVVALRHVLALKRLAGRVPFYVVRGSTDASIRARRESLLHVLAALDLVCYLEDASATFSKGGNCKARILGVGYHGMRARAFLEAAFRREAGRWDDASGGPRILLVNSDVGGLTTASPHAPLNLDDLPDWDYVGVGGSPRRREAPSRRAYAPGPAEHLSFQTSGEELGFYVVTWEDGDVDVDWRAVDCRPLVKVSLNVGSATVEAATKAVADAVRAADAPGAVLSVRVAGRLTNAEASAFPAAEIRKLAKKATAVLQVQNLLEGALPRGASAFPNVAGGDETEGGENSPASSPQPRAELELFREVVASMVRPGTSQASVQKVADLAHSVVELFSSGKPSLSELLAVVDATLKDAPVEVGGPDEAGRRELETRATVEGEEEGPAAKKKGAARKPAKERATKGREAKGRASKRGAAQRQATKNRATKGNEGSNEN
ncbi:MAG: hypothetical protein Kow0069_16300 [Promethearchaeota archaeon]